MKEAKGKFLRRSRGITLVALVVTIVILIILATISISVILGEGGLIGQAKHAREETRGGEVQDARDLWKANKELDEVTGKGTSQTLDELLVGLKKANKLTDAEIAIIKETGSIKIGSKTIVFGISLVDMLKKAEAEGCKNLDGKCSKKEHLHIGDYVNYKNPTSGSYTVMSDKSGVGYNQIYNVAENQLNWRVLGIDKTTGGIKLIAGSPMKKNGGTYFDIKGAAGYVYAPEEMDKIGALYKNEYAQNARSINMDDINQALGITTEEQIKGKNALPVMNSAAIQYGEKYGPFANQYTPEDFLKADKPTSTVEGIVNGYAYIIGGKGVPPEASNIAINIENTKLKNMLFDNVEPETGKAYWLASRGVYADSDGSYAYFGPGFVGSGAGMAIAGIGNGTFGSDGRESDYSSYAAVRPVVSLKSNITPDEVSKIADKTEENWGQTGGGTEEPR